MPSAAELLADHPVFDAHHDALQRALDLRHDLSTATRGQFDLPRARAGGVGHSVFACWVDGTFTPGTAAPRAHALMDAFDALLARHPEHVRRVTGRDDLDATRRAGVHGAICGIEGGHAIECDLGELERFAARGLRCMTLVWNNHLPWIRSCQAGGAGSPEGIDDFGRAVVRRMEELGVMVDLSHAGERAVFDVLDTATKPVIASHSGCKALRDHQRNLTDEQMRALAENGGVLGIVFLPAFLDAGAAAEDARVRASAAYTSIAAQDEALLYLEQCDVLQRDAAPLAIDRVVDHVAHAIDVMGVQHVGIGSDFDGIQRTPRGLEHAGCFAALVERMLARGFDVATVRAVLGDNMRRVFAATLPSGVAAHAR
jgi:membrane dipeptidase